jgi:Protein of unknown function, DUF547
MSGTNLLRAVGLLALVMLTGCASLPRPTGGEVAPGAPPYEAWARVLENHVDDEGRVNFSALALERADLDQFVAYVYAIAPNNHPQLFPTKAHVLAYHINAYNALSMYKVIETGIPATNAGFRKVRFFYLRKVGVGGDAISLYDYENKIIRPLGEPRIHMALNCMSVSCPRLPREVFLPETLEVQLQRETQKFFNEPRNVRTEEARATVHLSQILKFYRADFLASAPSLLAFANRYREQKVPENYRTKFIEYDWTINRQPGT